MPTALTPDLDALRSSVRGAVVTRGDEPEIAQPFDELSKVMTGAAAAGLVSGTQILEKDDHGSAVLKSHYFAFETIFEGWRPALDRQTRTHPDGLRGVESHYRRLSTRLGWTVAPPEAVINADMLPQDVGSMVPSMPGGDGGEHLMGLPLREAREVFEREYLVAQISQFGGNISRTAEFVGMERSALHRKLKALGID